MASIAKDAQKFMDEVMSEDLLFRVLRNPSVIKTEWRDLKLGLMLDDFKLKPDINKIKYKKNTLFRKEEQDYWVKVEENKDCIITGSMCLKAFGLIDRETNDVDLIVRDKTLVSDLTLLKQSHYDNITGIEHIGYFVYSITNFFGVKTGECNIEFFENKTATVIEHEGFKFHHPFEVMDKKLQIMLNRDTSGKTKDIKDFYSFKSKLIG